MAALHPLYANKTCKLCDSPVKAHVHSEIDCNCGRELHWGFRVDAEWNFFCYKHEFEMPGRSFDILTCHNGTMTISDDIPDPADYIPCIDLYTKFIPNRFDLEDAKCEICNKHFTPEGNSPEDGSDESYIFVSFTTQGHLVHETCVNRCEHPYKYLAVTMGFANVCRYTWIEKIFEYEGVEYPEDHWKNVEALMEHPDVSDIPAPTKLSANHCFHEIHSVTV